MDVSQERRILQMPSVAILKNLLQFKNVKIGLLEEEVYTLNCYISDSEAKIHKLETRIEALSKHLLNFSYVLNSLKSYEANDPSVQCPVCFNNLTAASWSYAPSCFHRLCENCLLDILSFNPVCPICRQAIDK